MNRIGKIIAIVIPWSLFAAALLYLAIIRFPLDGVTRFSDAFDGTGIWFTPFEPGERVTSPGVQPDGWRGQRILAEPVYASARWPGAYKTLELAFDLRTIRQSLVEIGIQRDADTMAFEMQPLWSEVLASTDWRQVQYGGLHGFVRSDLPDKTLAEQDPTHVMVWHASSTYTPPADSGTAVSKTYDVSLRGTHHFRVVPMNGEVNFTFDLQDVNRDREGKNVLGFRLACGKDIIWTDAGSASGSLDERPSAVFTRTVHVTDLPPCAYTLSVLSDNDFFIRRIETTNVHWVIGPQIFFGDRVGFRATTTEAVAWTNSLHIVVDTFHNEGKQFIRFGEAEKEIRETHARYPVSRAPGEQDRTVRFTAPKGNVRVIGDGYFALSEDALFLPEPRRLTADSQPIEEGIRAILTPYKKPMMQSGDFWRTSASFDLLPGQDKLQFSLAAPGIESRKGAVDLRHVTLTYRRPPLTLKEWFGIVKSELVLFLKRL